MYYKSLKVIEDFYASNGYEPSVSYIAEQLNASEFDISNAMNAMREPISMYEAVYNDGNDTIYLYDQIEDKKSLVDISNKFSLDNAINDLNSREKFILDQRYVMGKTQMEVAEELDISQAQVSRLEKKAIKELKKVLK